jgi:hypothetical protein
MWTALLASAHAYAEPMQLAAQGHLQSAGGPVADGNYAMQFALYDQPAGAKPFYLEPFLAVPVQAGVFAVTMGNGAVTLDSQVFASGKQVWLGVTVGGDPELPRQPLLRVPGAVHAQVATTAQGLQCSGCVDSAALAKGAITAEKIAAGAVGASHVNFAWAAADQPGGVANFALGANTAKLADQAKVADAAGYADEAGSAKTALVANAAKALQCTGCVDASMLAADIASQWVASGKLAAVAISGKYADLQGGPDLSGYGALAGNNTWAGAQTWNGAQSWQGALNFNKQQAVLFRYQNADKDPTPCDATAIGVSYYNTASNTLVICNGKAWTVFAKAAGIGSDVSNPAVSCAAIAAAGTTADGNYWLQPQPAVTPFQAYCDLKNGGWTLVMRLSAKSPWGYGHPVWTQSDDNTGMLPQPADNTDAVSRGFYKLQATETRVCLTRLGDGTWVCENVKHAAATARDLANGPQLPSSQGTNNLLTASWKSVVGGNAWGANAWHRWGWQHGTGGCGGARLGFSADNDSSDSMDSGIGIGIAANTSCSGNNQWGAGYWQYPWSPAPNPPSAQLQGQVWVR